MKRLPRKIFIFSLTVLLLYVVLMFSLSNIKYKNFPAIIYTSNYYPLIGGHTYTAFNDFEKENNLDILFLGSSHAYRGFDPRIFKKYGYSAFNLGTSGQSLESSKYIYQNYLTNKKVKTILLEVYSRQFENDENKLESNFDLSVNTRGNKIVISNLIDKKDWRFFNLFLYKNLNLSKEPVYKDETYVGKGFSENNSTTVSHNFKYPATFKPDPNKLNILKEIILLAQQNKQQLVLVSHPLPKEYPQNQHNDFVRFMNQIINKYNIPYFDYTFNHNLKSDTHFFDYNHMNQAGVEIFDSILINQPDFKKLLDAN